MLTDEDREELVNRVMKVYTSLDGLANLVNKSNFEQCLQIIELLPETKGEHDLEQFWSCILAIFQDQANKKSFFREDDNLMQGLTSILKVIEQTNVREIIKSEDTWSGM